ncbi:MAG: DNA polymerase III subunit delta' [Ramlibacter sp.]|nr:DNA polymerase III subunit delta' [Ramlibacter sp.]
MTAAAPWIAAQARQLLAQRGHAWLLQGPSGLGQYGLALELARAWLCDLPSAQGACGNCPSCHAVEVRAHTDLCVLMPETIMLELDWPLPEKAQQELDEKKRKPSKEIRVEAMRDAVEFAQRTSGRGRGKVVLVYPAERMNHVTANTLLKTLEEPAGDLRFVLASEAAHQLLPTLRSRCLGHTMGWPQEGEALAWLQAQGVNPADASPLLRAAGGRPEDALSFSRSARDAKAWAVLPKALARGDAGVLAGWTPAEAVSALQKLCHDLLAVKAGAAPRFFQAVDLPSAASSASFAALTGWARELAATVRTVEHPFHAGLMLETLVSRARSAINSKP